MDELSSSESTPQVLTGLPSAVPSSADPPSADPSATRLSSAQRLARWADRLRAISARGSHFSDNIYDKENYKNIQEIAVKMLGMATGQALEQMEPLKAPVLQQGTAFSVCDAAVIDDDGQILLIQRADNQLWAMPGGFLDVGESPSEGAIRETLEETGYSCEAISLIGVFDSHKCGTVSPFQLYHFLFLCKQRMDSEVIEPTHPNEILDVQWFAEDDLPPNIDPGHIGRIPEAYRVWKGDQRAYFDKPT